jgi:glucosamine--fructose-6-phosphate aminotransferase (isomerizing)
MCGIFGYVGKSRSASEVVSRGLQKLEYRGYDSWGVAVATSGRIAIDKRTGKMGGARAVLPESGAGLGHTRWATNGGVTRENAHPHQDCSERLAVVHNGIVTNDVELRRELLERGHAFRSETDSELIAHLLEESLRDQPRTADGLLEATRRVFRLLAGLNAIVVLDAETGALTAAKSGSPLVLGLGDSAHFLASDQAALVEHTRRVVFIRDGEALVMNAGEARVVDAATGVRRALDVCVAEWTDDAVRLGAHPDYMTKEMHEQPDALRRLAARGDPIHELARHVDAATDVFAVGCGSGHHAALAAEYLFARAGRRVRSVAASEFSHFARFAGPGTLVLALSQSGETIDVLEAVNAARARDGRVAAVCNVPGSSLTRIADFTLPLGVGPERCVVSTKAFTAKLAALVLAAGHLGGRSDEARRLVERAAGAVEALLGEASRESFRALALTLRDEEHAFVLGRGPSYPLALETALKIKEVSYLHAEGFAGGELKHGVIALIAPGTRCIALVPDDDTKSDVLAAAMQVKARGAVVIGLSPRPHPAFDHFVQIPDLGAASAIVNGVPGQLLGYELAKLRGLDPDMPRNLAKSVTVK